MQLTRLFNLDDVIDRSYKMRFCTGNGNKADCGHGDALFSTVDNNVTRGTVEFGGVGYSTISGIMQNGASRHIQSMLPSSLIFPRNRTLSTLSPIFPNFISCPPSHSYHQSSILTCFLAPSTLTSPLNPAMCFPALLKTPVMCDLVLCLVLAATSAVPPSCLASKTSASSSAVTAAGVVSLIASY